MTRDPEETRTDSDPQPDRPSDQTYPLVSVGEENPKANPSDDAPIVPEIIAPPTAEPAPATTPPVSKTLDITPALPVDPSSDPPVAIGPISWRWSEALTYPIRGIEPVIILLTLPPMVSITSVLIFGLFPYLETGMIHERLGSLWVGGICLFLLVAMMSYLYRYAELIVQTVQDEEHEPPRRPIFFSGAMVGAILRTVATSVMLFGPVIGLAYYYGPRDLFLQVDLVALTILFLQFCPLAALLPAALSATSQDEHPLAAHPLRLVAIHRQWRREALPLVGLVLAVGPPLALAAVGLIWLYSRAIWIAIGLQVVYWLVVCILVFIVAHQVGVLTEYGIRRTRAEEEAEAEQSETESDETPPNPGTLWIGPASMTNHPTR